MNRIRTLVATAAVSLLVSPVAWAQNVPSRTNRPVDRVIGDTDPLRGSLRVVEPGLSYTGQGATRVYQTKSGKFVYVADGVYAQYDRSQYRLNRDDEIEQTVPANTVFFIGPPEHYDSIRAQTTGQGVSPHAINQAVAGRISGQVGGTVDRRVDGRAHRRPAWAASGNTESVEPSSPWAAWRAARRRSQRRVFAALDAAMGRTPGSGTSP